jgi:thioester reductase-like protein
MSYIIVIFCTVHALMKRIIIQKRAYNTFFEVADVLALDLNHEAALAPEIQPHPTYVDLTTEPHNIFLTGATGFVAAHLLAELLDQTDATIYALVRAGDRRQGLARIRRNLSYYLTWRGRYENRVVPVCGDLKYPLLGLRPLDFVKLARTIDVVFHVGSKLSYLAPYQYLKAANVGGTRETLRLATMCKAKPYHFVSSLGILMNYEVPVGGLESDPLDVAKCPPIGYFQSKYVAERMVRIAQARGIPVAIYRIGLIVGDSKNGCSNEDDLVARILIGSIQAGYGPAIERAMDMTPVDYVARSIAYLSFQQASNGRVFHVLNPQPITWSSIVDSVIGAGYHLEKLPFDAWVQAIEHYADPATNPLQPLLPFLHLDFAARMFGVSDAAYHALGTHATQRALKGSGIDCPRVDQTLIQTYVQRFVDSGRLFPSPLRLAATQAG